jgi:nucleotide-binding universal stress UspA family protein
MQKILVPVDFSKCAENALNYAVELAKIAKAELILIHAFYVPVIEYNAAFTLDIANDLEKESLQSLEKLKQDILKMHSHLNVSYYCVQGIPVDVINLYASQAAADLIVIGAQGAGYIEERIFGNTATALIRKAATPLLVVNKQMIFRVPERIVLAVDYAETKNDKVLKPFKRLVALFNAHVFVLKVISDSHVPVSSEIQESLHLDHALKYVPHTFNKTQYHEVIDGINAFVTQHDIHLVVMIARRHSIISRIFKESLTKAMTFHSEVPLLVLHE